MVHCTHRQTWTDCMRLGEDAVKMEERSLSDYLKKAEVYSDRLLDVFMKEGCWMSSWKKKRNRNWLLNKKMQLDGWRDKSLNGQYPSRTNMQDVSCWRRLQTEYLKKKTKSLLMAAQDQTLATNAYRVTILKRQGSKKCRMCNDRDEAVMYILSECSKLAQTEYKKRHDRHHYGSLGTM